MEDMKYNNHKKALLVIDIQEEYTGATAKPPFPYKDSERLITTVNKLIEEASKKNILILYTRQEFDGFWGKAVSKLVGHGTAIKGKPGTEFDKRINIVSGHSFTNPLFWRREGFKLNKNHLISGNTILIL